MDSEKPGTRLLDLVAVMSRLRRDCPWDAKQTHESLAPHLLEESYEALEALASQDPEGLREELGDVLLQVMFHARLAQERTDGTGYDIDDVAEGITAKLTRRHPHVFAGVDLKFLAVLRDHDSRQLRRDSKPRRTQLFTLPRGAARRWAISVQE